MAIVVEVYKDFSDSKEIVFCECGKSVLENFPIETDWKDYKIICNNNFVSPDHIIAETDKIIIRKIPYGLSATAIAIASGIVAGITLGTTIYLGVKSYKTKKELKKIQDELERTKNIVKDDVTNLPYLKGATNTVSNGKTQPYMIGKNLFTPYIMNAGKNYKGFSSISGLYGMNQFYNVVLECGFNKQSLEKIYSDDIVLKTWNNGEVQEGKFNFDSSSVFASSDSFGEIAQDGNDFETSVFNQKIIEQSVSAKIEKKGSEQNEQKSLFYTLEPNSMAADVCVLLNGLRRWNVETGDEAAAYKTINFYYSHDYAQLVANGDSDPNAHAHWVLFPMQHVPHGTNNPDVAESNYIYYRFKTQARFNAHVNFNYSDIFDGETRRFSEPTTIKIECPDVDDSIHTYQDDSYVEWIHSYCYNTVKTKKARSFVSEKIIEDREMAHSTVLGLSIKSSESNAEKLKSIQIITNGLAKTFDGTSWSNNKIITSNPASWLLEVLTSDAHLPSKIDEDEIDLQSLGEWYNYCETKHLTVNYVITNGMTKQSLFDLICEAGNGHMYQNIYGQIAIAIDDKKDNAIAVLNEQNLISFNYQKDIKRKPDGLKLTFIDESLDYQENTIIIMADGSNPEERNADSILTSVRVDGKTNYEEVCRFGYRLLKAEKLRPKTVNAEIGEEGLFFVPLSKVLIQHPSLKIGKGNGEIKSLVLNSTNQIVGLELYDSVILDENANYSMIVQAVGTYADTDYCTPLEITIKGNKGITNEVEFVTPIPITAKVVPHAHDNFSYGLGTENVVDEMLVTQIDRSGNSYKLTLVDYDERIFDDSETLPDYEPNFSTPKKDVAIIPELPMASFDDLYGVKKDVEDDVDRKIAAATFEASPTYRAIFNTSVIKKDNTGSYTPSNISANGYMNKGLTEQTPFVGKWHIFVNESKTEYDIIEGSSINIDISDILDSGVKNIDTIRVSFRTNDGLLTIAEELIPILTGAAAYSVKLSTPSIVLEGDENKKVTETIIKTKAEVYYGLKELSYRTSSGWEYGVIESPDGMNISVDVDSGEITIKILEGTSLADVGSLKIPVFIHSQSSTQVTVGFTSETRATKTIVVGFDGVTIGYYRPDENGFYNTYFTWQKLSQNAVKLASLTTTVNNYWNEITNDRVVTVPEKNVLKRLIDDITVEYTKYEKRFRKLNSFSDYEKAYLILKPSVDGIISHSGNYTFASLEDKNDFNKKFEDYYAAKSDLDSEIASESVNYTNIKEVEDIRDLTPTVNDFFVWGGNNNTVYGETILQKGMTYCWNGDAWVEDNNRTHIMTTMDEALDLVKDSKNADIPAISFAKRLVTLQVIAEDVFAKYVEITSIMDSQDKTKIDGGKISTNSIKADSIDTTDLFAQNIEATNLHLKGDSTVEGTVYAKAGRFEGGIGKQLELTWNQNGNWLDADINVDGLELFNVYAFDPKTRIGTTEMIFYAYLERTQAPDSTTVKLLELKRSTKIQLSENPIYSPYQGIIRLKVPMDSAQMVSYLTVSKVTLI